MNYLKLFKGACVAASAVLASLLVEGIIPKEHAYAQMAAWLSGALAAAPAHLDRFWGYVNVHKDSLRPPPQLPPARNPLRPPPAPRDVFVPKSEWEDEDYRG